jgi:hypothetical protein
VILFPLLAFSIFGRSAVSSRWFCTVVTISPGLTSKPMVGFLVKPQNQVGEGFSGLALKTGSYDLVIWISKSP